MNLDNPNLVRVLRESIPNSVTFVSINIILIYAARGNDDVSDGNSYVIPMFLSVVWKKLRVYIIA